MNVQRISGSRGRTGPFALLLGALLVLVTACGGGGGGGSEERPGGGGQDQKVSQAVVTVAPKNGADGVRTSGALKITSARGTLTSVKVRDSEGRAVDGKIV